MSEPIPHIVPGQPRRSMYGEHNTHDEQVRLTAGAFQALVDAGEAYWLTFGYGRQSEREPIRVVAEVGRRIEA